jgi:hypothetical protein
VDRYTATSDVESMMPQMQALSSEWLQKRFLSSEDALVTTRLRLMMQRHKLLLHGYFYLH